MSIDLRPCPFCGGEIERRWQSAVLQCRECEWAFTVPLPLEGFGEHGGWRPQMVIDAWQKATVHPAPKPEPRVPFAAKVEDAMEKTACPSFADFIAEVRPGFRYYAHTQALVTALQQVADGETPRLLLMLPPRHGLSTLVSELFPAYCLCRNPDTWALLATYNNELATMHTGRAHAAYAAIDPPLVNFPMGRHWYTSAHGGMATTEVGSPLPAKQFRLGVIDSPLKTEPEARDAALLEKQWKWFWSTFGPRFGPEGMEVVAMSRQAFGDLAGRILESEAFCWTILRLPAMAEENDPLGRKIGEALCPEVYPAERLRKIKRQIGAERFFALYQQCPLS